MENTTRPGAYAALRLPDYRRFLAMRMTMTLAVQIMSVSVGYFVYDLTNDPLMLGFIGLAEAIPVIAVSLYAGHIADKVNRRNLLMACIAVLFLCTASLLVLALYRDALPKTMLLTGIYTVIFATGIAQGFYSPANFSFLPQLVDRKLLTNAITWNSSTWEVASITGLGIGGLIYGFYGVSAAFAVMTVLCLIGLIFVMQITPRPAPPPPNEDEDTYERIKEGLKFVRGNRVILGAIALDLFAVLFGGAVALLPVFAKDILKVGPEGLGVLRAAMSLGAISMAIFLAHRPLGADAGRVMLYCVAGFGLCIITFGLSQWFWLSFLALYVAGVMDEVSVVVRASLIQHLTPDHMKGRVSSVNSIFITSSNEIGAFESGLAAKVLGTVPSVVFGGLMTIVVVAVTWWRVPQLRQIDFKKLTGASAEPENKPQ